jgi:hypothetical protein
MVIEIYGRNQFQCDMCSALFDSRESAEQCEKNDRQKLSEVYHTVSRTSHKVDNIDDRLYDLIPWIRAGCIASVLMCFLFGLLFILCAVKG